MKRIFSMLLAFGLLSAVAAPVLLAAEAPEQSRFFLAQDDGDDPDDPEGDEDFEDEEPSASLDGGLLSLSVGRYKAAKLEFKDLLKADKTDQKAAAGLAETYRLTGGYSLAIKTLEKVITAAGENVTRKTLVALARLQFETGDYPACTKSITTLLGLDPQDIDALTLRGLMEHEFGQYDTAEATFESVVPAIAAKRKGPLQRDSDKTTSEPDVADMWATAGVALFMLNDLHQANSCWQNALDTDEYNQRATKWLSRLSLEQNHDTDVNILYAGPYLRHNPNDAENIWWTAQVDFYKWRSGVGMKKLERALKTNKNQPDILAFRAIQFILTDQYEAGAKDYNRALKTNPYHTLALAAKGLHAKTLSMKDLWDEADGVMRSINPKPAKYLEAIADGLSYRHRYSESLPLYKQALEYNPKAWTIYKAQGMAAMNFGDDILGKKSLQTAHKNDPIRNNLRTLNLLTLLDSYKNYKRVISENGRWRLLIHKKEAHIMTDLYLEALDACYDDQKKKYNFEPQLPLVIEAFPEHADFEVRTVGITGLPALGACFGQLITLDSPSARPAGTYNWHSTLRHEMDHVFQLQISKGQVPRWLAEGLSVYEEKTTRPEWERHMEDQLHRLYWSDDIPPVKKFNEWFRDGSKILFAYYLGNVMLEFIDKELGGFTAVRDMLELFGQKKTPEEVFRKTLNIEPEEFDQQFREYVAEKRIKHLRMVKFINNDRMDELLDKAEFEEASVQELIWLARGYQQQGKNFDAQTWLGIAGRKGAEKLLGEPGAMYWWLKAQLVRGDTDKEANERQTLFREYIDKAMVRGLEDFQTYLVLFQMARQANQNDEALKWLLLAKEAFPENSQPYQILYQYHQGMKEEKKAIKAAEDWMSVDENNLNIRIWLIENVYRKSRNWTKMEDMAYQAINVAPLLDTPHRFRAFALRKLERWDEAVKEYEYVRRMAKGTPEEALKWEVEALLDIATTWLNAEDEAKCRKALEQAKALDPKHPGVKVIEEELEGTEEEEEDF
ncbi:tetratricopeptide repeat protein [Planctomycetota bacterium]|nr:tetratricopeptide repeat protein [Planctomycetota bacterium]